METAAIWRTYSESLYRFILKKVENEALAKDLLQDAFFKIHLHHSMLKDEKAMKSWVFQIAHNLIMDHFRKSGKIFPVAEADEVEKPAEDHTPVDCLLPLIKRLPASYKKALLLSEIEGRKQAEVAKILNLSLSGAKSRIQRGRKLLQEGLMDCCGYQINEKGYLVGESASLDECKVC